MVFLRHEKIMQMLPMINGIFAHIHYEFPDFLTITDEELDLAFLSLYGLRLCAPVVHVVHTNHEQLILTDTELQTLADLIKAMYKHNWDRLADILSIEYDPIHNYQDTYHEELTEGITGDSTRTPNISVADSSTATDNTTVTDGGTERRTTNRNDTDNRNDFTREEYSDAVVHKKFGFNSPENEPVGDSVDESQSVRTNELTVEDTKEGTEQTVINGGLTRATQGTKGVNGTKRTTGNETEEHSSDRERVRDFTHLGNIGNLTTQQLLTQEIELWRWNFIQHVLNDVKDFLTLPVYD